MNLKKFTLLELLLVIAIILILLSLIIPSIIKAQRQAELVVCMNNLKGIGNAVALYHKDNKRYFPGMPGDTYVNSNDTGFMNKYLDDASVAICPMNPSENDSYNASAGYHSRGSTTDFNLNYTRTTGAGERGLKASKILRPATMSLLISKSIYGIGTGSEAWRSNTINNTTYWHTLDLTPKVPFLSVAGGVKNQYFTGALYLTNSLQEAKIIDFANTAY